MSVSFHLFLSVHLPKKEKEREREEKKEYNKDYQRCNDLQKGFADDERT
jgi:hypothetical protein